MITGVVPYERLFIEKINHVVNPDQLLSVKDMLTSSTCKKAYNTKLRKLIGYPYDLEISIPRKFIYQRQWTNITFEKEKFKELKNAIELEDSHYRLRNSCYVGIPTCLFLQLLFGNKESFYGVLLYTIFVFGYSKKLEQSAKIEGERVKVITAQIQLEIRTWYNNIIFNSNRQIDVEKDVSGLKFVACLKQYRNNFPLTTEAINT